jgi:hypothetical protein
MNIVVTIYIVKRDDLNAIQKVFQGIFIWVIPILGGMFVYSLNRSYDTVIGGDCGDIASDYGNAFDEIGGDGD